MDVVMEIAKYVLIIGGALCIIIFFVLLLQIVILLSKLKSLLTGVQQSYQQFSVMMLMPRKKIKTWLREENETKEEREETESKRKK